MDRVRGENRSTAGTREPRVERKDKGAEPASLETGPWRVLACSPGSGHRGGSASQHTAQGTRSTGPRPRARRRATSPFQPHAHGRRHGSPRLVTAVHTERATPAAPREERAPHSVSAGTRHRDSAPRAPGKVPIVQTDPFRPVLHEAESELHTGCSADITARAKRGWLTAGSRTACRTRRVWICSSPLAGAAGGFAAAAGEG